MLRVTVRYGRARRYFRLQFNFKPRTPLNSFVCVQERMYVCACVCVPFNTRRLGRKRRNHQLKPGNSIYDWRSDVFSLRARLCPEGLEPLATQHRSRFTITTVLHASCFNLRKKNRAKSIQAAIKAIKHQTLALETPILITVLCRPLARD